MDRVDPYHQVVLTFLEDPSDQVDRVGQVVRLHKLVILAYLDFQKVQVDREDLK